jgi:hypothetical protein
MRNKILLSLVAIALTAMMISYAYASWPCPCGCGLSPGYWKHNVKVYNGGPGHYSGDPKEDDGTMESYEGIIAGELGPTGFDGGPFTLERANDYFQDNAYKAWWLTIANWFNAASGRFAYSD